MGLDMFIYRVKNKDFERFKKLTLKQYEEPVHEETYTGLTEEEEKELGYLQDEVVYFKKFYEFDKIIRGEPFENDDDAYVKLDLQFLEDLYNDLSPCYPLLLKLTDKQIDKLEEGINSLSDFLPQKQVNIIENCLYKTKMEEDGSSYFYTKLLKLISFLKYWLEVYDSNFIKEYTFVYYRSY